MERKQQHKANQDADDDDDEQHILVYDLGGGTFGKANTGQKHGRVPRRPMILLILFLLTTQLLIRFLFDFSLLHLILPSSQQT